MGITDLPLIGITEISLQLRIFVFSMTRVGIDYYNRQSRFCITVVIMYIRTDLPLIGITEISLQLRIFVFSMTQVGIDYYNGQCRLCITVVILYIRLQICITWLFVILSF
jgi:hypothetical protein